MYGKGKFGLGARFIPPGSCAVRSKISPAVVYLSGQPDRLMAIGYYGKAINPSFHFRFKSEVNRAKYVGDWIRSKDASVAAKVVRKEAEKAKRAEGHKLKPGSILRSSWGYEQSNVDYYQVIELVGAQSVKIREIGSSDVSGDEDKAMGDRGYCVPVPDAFLVDAPEMVKRVVSSGDGVRISSYAAAFLVEPVVDDGSIKIYPRSYWSSYA